ncbi:FadR/GntR family transcriptional regulator [Amycolatopsis kentuckyensis]|uniref:FadR/GntR family transcriptional regulator n=1 Tax=Amycolatopsis kentuckyensis TaxID=218823 RepID=UPI000A3C76DE|nr:FCD domain-containing protein [Amycolatopsis kentuckyensis]
MRDEADEAGGGERVRGSSKETLDELGRKIVRGAPGYRPGDALSVESVVADLKVSKPMAREVLQTLHHMRLIRIMPRVGATVLDLPSWDMLNRTVIEWRLDEPSPRHVRRSLTELRAAIEPAAARLAASRAPAAVCHELLTLAQQLHEVSLRDHFDHAVRTEFRELDAAFHSAILRASDNEAFQSLTYPIVLAMNHRIDRHYAGDKRHPAPAGGDTLPDFPVRPLPVAMWFHRFLASAIAQGRPRAAEVFSRGLLAEVDGELSIDAQLRDSILREIEEVETADADREAFKAELVDAVSKAWTRTRNEMGWTE